MGLFRELRQNPPKLEVVGKPTKVILYMISAMCDNKGFITFEKKKNGYYFVSSGNQAFSNFQIKAEKFEIGFLADDGKWNEVFYEINQGVSVIQKVLCRE